MEESITMKPRGGHFSTAMPATSTGYYFSCVPQMMIGHSLQGSLKREYHWQLCTGIWPLLLLPRLFCHRESDFCRRSSCTLSYRLNESLPVLICDALFISTQLPVQRAHFMLACTLSEFSAPLMRPSSHASRRPGLAPAHLFSGKRQQPL